MVYKEEKYRGALGKDVNRGISKLLTQNGDKALIKNWCPIKLLNVSYKILAKVLEMRYTRILLEFMSNIQTGFIKGRYILDNLVTSGEAAHWAKQDN